MNEHSNLRGKHARFSPSNPRYLSDTPEEFRIRNINSDKAALGSLLHEWSFYKIKRCHKITSNKDMLNSIDEFIFKQYYNPESDTISTEGRRMLKALKYVDPLVFDTIKSYVNDAIGFKMFPEVVVYYSDSFFGTADALIFKDNFLRIHDLKTGSTPPHMEQLLGYAAYFCLEYRINPMNIETELRIYQNNDILIANPAGADIRPLMDRTIEFDKINEEYEGGTV